MLRELDSLPEGVLAIPASGLLEKLGGPCLIHLNGLKTETLFVSVLLHGNEPVGWDAIRTVLKSYTPGGGQRELPRSLSVFIGNVEAASKGVRRLDGQVDYNRVWPGGDEKGAEADMMQRVFDIMKKKNLFASLDIHNNTGMNPHYGCINKTDFRFLRLAHLFRRLVIYFTRPTGVQSLAFSKICPAITIEAGKAGMQMGIDHAAEFIDQCLHLYELSDEPLHHEEIDLYHTVATVKIPTGTSFDFEGYGESDISFVKNLERLNFNDLQSSTDWAKCSNDEVPLRVVDEDGRDVRNDYFKVESGVLKTYRPIMPAMLTTDHKIVEQDCLCYLMEKYPLPE